MRVSQKTAARSEVGVDAYYKRATNLLDDGQFGQALVLTAFNYDRPIIPASNSRPIIRWAISGLREFRLGRGSARRRSHRTNISSRQRITYISRYYIYTDHAQT